MSTDMQILNLLRKNAKLSNGEIATMLGLDTAAVDAAVSKMEKDGLIMGYGAIINTEKLCNDKVSALIEVKISPQRERGFDAIASLVYSYPEVTSCYLMSGTYDLMVIVEGENIRDVAGFVSARLSVLDNVISCATHFILKRYKQDGNTFASAGTSERQAVSP